MENEALGAFNMLNSLNLNDIARVIGAGDRWTRTLGGEKVRGL